MVYVWSCICWYGARFPWVSSHVRRHTLYKNVDTLMESHDLPRTGSAKWRILSANWVWPSSSNSQIRLLQHGSSPPQCPPPSQHSTTARRRFSLLVSWSCSISSYLPPGISRSPRTVHFTPCTASQTFSTVSGGAKVEREGEQCETNRTLQTLLLYSDKPDPTNPAWINSMVQISTHINYLRINNAPRTIAIFIMWIDAVPVNIALNLCTAAALGPVRDSDRQTATLAVVIQPKGVVCEHWAWNLQAQAMIMEPTYKVVDTPTGATRV